MWKSFYKRLQANSWAWLNVVLGLAILAMVYLRFYKPDYLARKWWVGIFVTILFLLFLVLLAGYHRRNYSEGGQSSIMMKDVFMKSGPDERSNDLKRLYPGYKLILLDEINGWYKVRTIDREEGWVHPRTGDSRKGQRLAHYFPNGQSHERRCAQRLPHRGRRLHR